MPGTPDPSARCLVDVWHGSLAPGHGELEAMLAVLAPEERRRAERLRTATLRERYVAARAFLRGVLAAHGAASRPEDVVFDSGPAGKPRVAGGFEFNLTHSGERALCAVARDAAVGLDMERIDPDADVQDIAAVCFTRREIEAIERLSGPERAHAFFTTWTRKEAYVKALGTGLATPMLGFEVPMRPGTPPQLAWGPGPRPPGSWTVIDLPAPAGYAASLVVRASSAEVRMRIWLPGGATVVPRTAEAPYRAQPETAAGTRT
jgi:4'-phosphopantetheinyl transferase